MKGSIDCINQSFGRLELAISLHSSNGALIASDEKKSRKETNKQICCSNEITLLNVEEFTLIPSIKWNMVQFRFFEKKKEDP